MSDEDRRERERNAVLWAIEECEDKASFYGGDPETHDLATIFKERELVFRDLLARLEGAEDASKVDAGVSAVFHIFEGDSWREAALRTVVHAAQAPYRYFRPDRLEGEPVAWMTEAKVGDGEWCAASFWLVEDDALYQAEKFEENDGTQGRLVPLYRRPTLTKDEG